MLKQKNTTSGNPRIFKKRNPKSEEINDRKQVFGSFQLVFGIFHLFGGDEHYLQKKVEKKRNMFVPPTEDDDSNTSRKKLSSAKILVYYMHPYCKPRPLLFVSLAIGTEIVRQNYEILTFFVPRCTIKNERRGDRPNND